MHLKDLKVNSEVFLATFKIEDNNKDGCFKGIIEPFTVISNDGKIISFNHSKNKKDDPKKKFNMNLEEIEKDKDKIDEFYTGDNGYVTGIFSDMNVFATNFLMWKKINVKNLTQEGNSNEDQK